MHREILLKSVLNSEIEIGDLVIYKEDNKLQKVSIKSINNNIISVLIGDNTKVVDIKNIYFIYLRLKNDGYILMDVPIHKDSFNKAIEKYGEDHVDFPYEIKHTYKEHFIKKNFAKILA